MACFPLTEKVSGNMSDTPNCPLMLARYPKESEWCLKVVWIVSRKSPDGCLDGVWTGQCLDDDGLLSGVCLDGVSMLSG